MNERKAGTGIERGRPEYRPAGLFHLILVQDPAGPFPEAIYFLNVPLQTRCFYPVSPWKNETRAGRRRL